MLTAASTPRTATHRPSTTRPSHLPREIAQSLAWGRARAGAGARAGARARVRVRVSYRWLGLTLSLTLTLTSVPRRCDERAHGLLTPHPPADVEGHVLALGVCIRRGALLLRGRA